SGFSPFPVAGILGKDYVDLGNNTVVTGGVGSNGQVTLANGANVTGSVSLWSGAPNPIGFSGTVVRSPTPYVLSPPNMLNPGTLLDSSTSNDNGRLLAGASPADSCSGGNGQGSTCYTDTSSSPRTLSLGNQGSVTLGGGVYNFCQINLGQSASVNVASGAKILLYIDSPSRGTAASCTPAQGGST